MKKLKLDLNELRVQTFDLQPHTETNPKGTVFGFENPEIDSLPSDDTCACPDPSNETCGEWTCLLSCAVTC